MRVIYEVTSYRVACAKCKSLLEFGLEDVYYGPRDYHVGQVRCPVCSCNISVLFEKEGSSHLEENVTPIYNCEKSSASNCNN